MQKPKKWVEHGYIIMIGMIVAVNLPPVNHPQGLSVDGQAAEYWFKY